MARMKIRECGVRAADLESQWAAVIEFAAEMYRPLVRCDQRAKGEHYVPGLLLEGRRKSIQPMAARLPDELSDAGVGRCRVGSGVVPASRLARNLARQDILT